MAFENLLKKFVEDFDRRSNQYFSERLLSPYSFLPLEESKSYSFFSGGKRFRPFLTFLASQSLKLNFEDVFPIALATEMIHTYSLIHDDLPCMDNDDFRRGQPTNHKKFGEDVALLAGDGFLSDAFTVLTDLKCSDAAVVVRIIKNFSEAIGSFGMVSGQAQDMKADRSISFENLARIHFLKTGRLIENSIVAVALFAQVKDSELQAFSSYGKNLGLAFQIKDDLLDIKDNDQDLKSYPFLIGLEATTAELQRVTLGAEKALAQLQQYDLTSLKMLLDYNLQRIK